MIKTLLKTVKKNKNIYAFLFCFSVNSNAQTVEEIDDSIFEMPGTE